MQTEMPGEHASPQRNMVKPSPLRVVPWELHTNLSHRPWPSTPPSIWKSFLKKVASRRSKTVSHARRCRITYSSCRIMGRRVIERTRRLRCVSVRNFHGAGQCANALRLEVGFSSTKGNFLSNQAIEIYLSEAWMGQKNRTQPFWKERLLFKASGVSGKYISVISLGGVRCSEARFNS